MSTTTPPSPLRIGIAGVGFMGRQHIDFVRRSQRAELVAVADPVADLDDVGCAAYRDLEGLLGNADVEAVILVTPNRFHVDSAIACIERGAAVLLEKPVATSYVESLRLIEAVERTQARLLVGHHRRHHPAITRARDALRGGAVGDLVGVSGMWAARKEDEYFTDIEWHRRPGAGVTFINLVHDLDLLRHVCGEIVEVHAMLSSATRGLDVEDSASVTVRFENGALGSFLATDAGVSPWGWDQSTEESKQFPFLPGGVAYRVTGTTGALSVPDLAQYSYGADVSPNWHSPLSRTFLPVEPKNTFDAQLDHFIDVAHGVAEPLVSAKDAARTLALIEAVHHSATTRQVVDLERFRADRRRAHAGA
ncbi:Gfo/Idh/MocA family protein [Microbacterium sp. NPDC055910]|uniref:Gfo/Idh/MocA family protein n=1 Tax=Microbacterium sp. NPDC055910 TaxID=3345659 RepID=UPI0035E1547A